MKYLGMFLGAAMVAMALSMGLKNTPENYWLCGSLLIWISVLSK